jgi:hypothetical protein
MRIARWVVMAPVANSIVRAKLKLMSVASVLAVSVVCAGAVTVKIDGVPVVEAAGAIVNPRPATMVPVPKSIPPVPLGEIFKSWFVPVVMSVSVLVELLNTTGVSESNSKTKSPVPPAETLRSVPETDVKSMSQPEFMIIAFLAVEAPDAVPMLIPLSVLPDPAAPVAILIPLEVAAPVSAPVVTFKPYSVIDVPEVKVIAGKVMFMPLIVVEPAVVCVIAPPDDTVRPSTVTVPDVLAWSGKTSSSRSVLWFVDTRLVAPSIAMPCNVAPRVFDDVDPITIPYSVVPPSPSSAAKPKLLTVAPDCAPA